MGDTFLRNYYTIYDHDNSKVGIMPHKTSNATILKDATLPTAILLPTETNSNQPTYDASALVNIVVMIVVVVGVVLLLVYVI